MCSNLLSAASIKIGHKTNMKDIGDTPEKHAEEGIFHGPWEKSFEKIHTPFEEFIHQQTTTGLLLMGAAILALVLANSGFSEMYQHRIHTPLGINIGGWALTKSLQHWVNDGLMALFFFLVGLEHKREILVGVNIDTQ